MKSHGVLEPGSGLVAERQEATSASLGETYGGSNVGNSAEFKAKVGLEWMGRQHSILIHLPPLATVAFRLEK